MNCGRRQTVFCPIPNSFHLGIDIFPNHLITLFYIKSIAKSITMNRPEKKEGSILIIEDNFDVQLSARLLLKQYFSEVKTHDQPEHAIQELRRRPFDVIILDMNFSRGETSGKEGLHWLKKIIELNPSNQVIMITAFGDIDLAIKAVKIGARDFVLKPWENEKLISTVTNVFNSRGKNKLDITESRKNTSSENPDKDYSEFIGESPSIKKVLSDIEKVSKTDADVLILGENGTGKELVARAIHKLSGRNNQSFIKVDLGSIPESLFESELFGHKKGAFTDAREDRTGRFEAADGGTLFLDEIGNLSHHLQAKLLTVLQSRQVIQVGSNKASDIDVRLISATNNNLHEMASSNTFRRDLLYRINTVEIKVPPLRERVDDIPALAEHFLSIYSKRYNKSGITISSGGFQKLRSYNWPGNIRELRHAIERAVILSDHHLLQAEDFQLETHGNDENKDLYTLNLEDLEKDAIKQALVRYQGNISQASKELGLTRSALYRRLEKYGL